MIYEYIFSIELLRILQPKLINLDAGEEGGDYRIWIEKKTNFHVHF